MSLTDRPMGTTGDDIKNRILDMIPNWVGFMLIIAAGVVSIIVGATLPNAGFVAFGVWGIASSILAWWSGAKSTPTVNPFKKSFGGTVKNIDGWVWLVIFLLFVVAIVIAIAA